jgi:hypothetical protein
VAVTAAALASLMLPRACLCCSPQSLPVHSGASGLHVVCFVCASVCVCGFVWDVSIACDGRGMSIRNAIPQALPVTVAAPPLLMHGLMLRQSHTEVAAVLETSGLKRSEEPLGLFVARAFCCRLWPVL